MNLKALIGFAETSKKEASKIGPHAEELVSVFATIADKIAQANNQSHKTTELTKGILEAAQHISQDAERDLESEANLSVHASDAPPTDLPRHTEATQPSHWRNEEIRNPQSV